MTDGDVRVTMTMTMPGCPLSAQIANWAETAIRQQIPEAHSVDVKLVWTPPWNPMMMSDEAKSQLGWD